MKKILSILLLAFVGILSLCCFAACGEDGGGTHTGGGDNGGGTDYVPNENSHLLKEGETVCEHCGEQLFEGELKFTLSDNKKYYKLSDLGGASGDVIVPDYFCSRGDDTYLPVLEISGNTGDETETLEISAVAEECKIYSGSGLKEIRVAEGNAHYAAKDGVLYDKASTKLHVYPCAKENSSFSVPAGVTEIGKNAFYGSDNLQSVEISETVGMIGDSAFGYCELLRSVEFAQGSAQKTLGAWAFANCVALRSITLPASVETIGEETFYNCKALTAVKFSSDSVLKTIEKSAFSRCESLQTIEIPAGVQSIGESTFSFCTALTKVEFAQNSVLQSIGANAFSWCTSLLSIEIPASVETI